MRFQNPPPALGLLIPLCMLATSLHAAPRVAVMYSSWGDYGFRDEFGPHLARLGWASEAFENTDVANLVSRLGEFDIVVSAGVANYENSVDMAPYREAWLSFLAEGGLLLITDANYASVLDLWTNRLGEAFALRSETCARHTRVGPDPDRNVNHPSDLLLYAPDDLAGALASRGNIWAHIVPVSPEWRSVITCADDRSLFVYRDVGKGCLAVTSHYSFRGPEHGAAASVLLGNLWCRVQGLRAGLTASRFDPGPALPGKHEAVLGLGNPGRNAAEYRVRLLVAEGGGPAETAATARVVLDPGAGADLRLPYAIRQRTEVRIEARIEQPGIPPFVLSRTQAIPPPVSLYVPERHAYIGQTALKWSCTLAPDMGVPPGELAAELTLDGNPVAAFPAPAPTLAGTADLTGPELGPHALEMVLKRGETVLGAARAEITIHPPPRVRVRPDDLTTLVDGVPFFPMGFYHVSWSFPAEDRLQFLREVAAAGFNTVHASLKEMGEWGPFLDEAERLKMKVITEFGVDMPAAIARYKGREPILAWNPGDEPDGAGVPPAVMLERHNTIRSMDADVPTYMTLCVPSAFAKYAGMADVIAPDPYPIRHAGAATMPVFATIRSAVETATPLGRPIWAIPQAFGYDDPKSWRVPTFAEERNMTYLALLAGAKGLIYYTYRDPGFDMREHADLWQGMASLPGEIRALEPFLLNGTRSILDAGHEDVVAGHWTAAGRHILCVVNTSGAESREMALPLPPGVAGNATDLFPNRPGHGDVRDGKLTGTLGPLGIAVCEIAE